MTRSRLRGDDILHPHHGVYDVVSERDDLIARCERLGLVLGGTTWFSHLTAARLWGAPTPRRWDPSEPLHITTLGSDQPVRRRGVVGWETRRPVMSSSVLGLLPVLDAAEVWCQLAVPGAMGRAPDAGRKMSLGEEWLVAVGDFLVSGPRTSSGRRPLCSVDDLDAARRGHGRRRGALALREALARIRVGVDSPFETFTRLGLVDHGLAEPRVQVPVMTAVGPLHADLGYPAARVALEFQGDEHRASRPRWLRDLTRVQAMQDAGWHVILFGADDVRPDISRLAARVRRALTRHL